MLETCRYGSTAQMQGQAGTFEVDALVDDGEEEHGVEAVQEGEQQLGRVLVQLDLHLVAPERLGGRVLLAMD